MRVAVLGSQNRSLGIAFALPGVHIDYVGAERQGDQALVSKDFEGIIDYDLYVVDADTIEGNRDHDGYRDIGAPITERVRAGAALLCFPARGHMKWLPFEMNPRGGPAGRLVRIVTDDPPLRAFLERFQPRISYRVEL